MIVVFNHYFNFQKDRQVECERLEVNKRFDGGVPVYRAHVSGSYLDFPVDSYYITEIWDNEPS